MSAEPDISSLTDPGWPRPIIGGYPISWVSPASDLSKTNSARHTQVLTEKICQVCGEGHEFEDTVYLVINDEQSVAGEDITDKWAMAVDDGILHERCLRLAAGRCPRLKRLRSEVRLVIVSCKLEAVQLNYEEEYERERLMADGAQAVVLDTEQFLSRTT